MEDKIVVEDYLKNNERFIHWTLRKFGITKGFSCKYYDFEDLYQEILVSLCRHLPKYNKDKGELTTYTYFIISTTIKMFLYNVPGEFKYPRKILEIDNYLYRTGLNPSENLIPKIAESFDCSEEMVKLAFGYHLNKFQTFSIDAEIGGGSKNKIEDILYYDNVENFISEKYYIDNICKTLGSKEEKVLRLYIDGETTTTIGKIIGVSQPQVSRYLKSIKGKIKLYFDNVA